MWMTMAPFARPITIGVHTHEALLLLVDIDLSIYPSALLFTTLSFCSSKCTVVPVLFIETRRYIPIFYLNINLSTVDSQHSTRRRHLPLAMHSNVQFSYPRTIVDWMTLTWSILLYNVLTTFDAKLTWIISWS